MEKRRFTLIEIMIVVALIGMLAALAIPSFLLARTTSRKNACLSNLRIIDNAKQQWAMANDLTDDAVPAWTDLVSSAGGGYLAHIPVCGAGGVYALGAVRALPTCTVSGH